MEKDAKKPHGMNQYKKIWATINGMKAKDEIIETRLDGRVQKLESDIYNIKEMLDIRLSGHNHEFESALKKVGNIALILGVSAISIAIVSLIAVFVL
jgi:hypothetical protein